uniref:Integral membrane protein n=1 Tax=Rhabditophanes sp. KR3021 TaxID=114890 RepID=A0AC35U3V8_9BILA
MFDLTSVFSIILVSFIWGASNPFIRQGALDTTKANRDQGRAFPLHIISDVYQFFANWRFAVPFLINQSGSVLFNLLLTQLPTTLIVPTVNSLTFIWTAVIGSYVEGKSISLQKWIGIGVCLSGIALITIND